MERLQEEQKLMLDAERKKREEFERLQQDKEQQLRGNLLSKKLSGDFNE